MYHPAMTDIRRINATREARREARRRLLEAERRMNKPPPNPPKVKLNPDQAALRRVLEYDFWGNRELMASELGLTSRGVARYVQEGVGTPKWELMEQVAELVGLTVDQLRAEGHGHTRGIYLVGSDSWIDPKTVTTEDLQRIMDELRQDSPGGAEDPKAKQKRMK